MVFPGAYLFRVPIWCPSGSGGTREVGSTVAESLVTLYLEGTHQTRREGRREARSSTSQGSAEPLCARIKIREVPEGKADLWPPSVFFLRGSTRSGERARFVGLLQRCTGFGRLEADSRASFTSSRLPLPPWNSAFQFSLCFCIMCGLEKLEFVDLN